MRRREEESVRVSGAVARAAAEAERRRQDPGGVGCCAGAVGETAEAAAGGEYFPDSMAFFFNTKPVLFVVNNHDRYVQLQIGYAVVRIQRISLFFLRSLRPATDTY